MRHHTGHKECDSSEGTGVRPPRGGIREARARRGELGRGRQGEPAGKRGWMRGARERPVSTEFRWRQEKGETRQTQEDGGKNRARDTLRKRQKHRDGDE